MIVFTKSRAKRFEIGRLLGEGHTLEQAENIVFKGDSNRARTVKVWKESGVYPYGGIDGPQEQIQSATTANTLEPLHYAHTAITHTPKEKPKTAIAKSNDTALDDRIRALIKEVLAEQDTRHTVITDIGEAPKLWRTTKNVVPVSFRLQKTLFLRARAALQEKYKGTISLNRYVELCLWELVGRPDDLLRPEK